MTKRRRAGVRRRRRSKEWSWVIIVLFHFTISCFRLPCAHLDLHDLVHNQSRNDFHQSCQLSRYCLPHTTSHLLLCLGKSATVDSRVIRIDRLFAAWVMTRTCQNFIIFEIFWSLLNISFRWVNQLVPFGILLSINIFVSVAGTWFSAFETYRPPSEWIRVIANHATLFLINLGQRCAS